MRQRTLAALFLVLLIAAGCGGGNDRLSKEEYETSVEDITTRAGFAIEIGGETPPREIPERLEDAVRSLQESARQLKSLRPPQEAQEAHDLLLEGIEDLRDEVRRLRDEVAEIDDPVELRQTVDERRGVLPALGKIEAAQLQFNQLGYTF